MAFRVARTRSTEVAYVGYRRDGPAAASTVAVYACPEMHRFGIRLAEEAVAPHEWDCTRHGTKARLVDGSEPIDLPAGKHVRTPWDMLRERRTIDELELLLEERLLVLRGRRGK